jgi:hypothetical protein
MKVSKYPKPALDRQAVEKARRARAQAQQVTQDMNEFFSKKENHCDCDKERRQ